MTYKELADALEGHAAKGGPYFLLMAAQRLRDMPEGKRIEGFAMEMVGEKHGCNYYFVRGSPPNTDNWNVPTTLATLTIRKRKEGESDE